MPVNESGLGLLNPVTSAKEKYLSSKWVSAELIWDMMGVGAFSDTNRLLALREERCDRQKDRDITNENKLKNMVQELKGIDRRLILPG